MTESVKSELEAVKTKAYGDCMIGRYVLKTSDATPVALTVVSKRGERMGWSTAEVVCSGLVPSWTHDYVWRGTSRNLLGSNRILSW